ncbi:universal stress protein [Sphingomonas sp. UNC305MFCol5.2]|uniref:universal stress protein n=1 Tax=Sphingomonas sp. UNC305MFCol5.2 TaxID=1449076 RepID=UPI0004A703B5|nr:universal stress protein [Sphingomonas sp. UNC305MFCol5.2]
MIKDLLIVIDNSSAADSFLQAAVAFTERSGARGEVAMLSPGPLAAADLAPFGALYVPDEVLQREEEARLTAVRASIAEAKCPIEVYGLRDDIAWVPHDLRLSRPMADLILVGGPDSWEVPWLHRRVLETLLLSTGTPLLIMPAGRPLGPIHRAVLGWKPSREANRAVHDLVALAEPGAAIDVMLVDEDAKAGTRPDVVEVERHLNRHGFKPSVHVSPPGDWSSTADMLEHYAVQVGADVLVAGGYAHSRMREAVLGGVTRGLLGQVRLPVLLSH